MESHVHSHTVAMETLWSNVSYIYLCQPVNMLSACSMLSILQLLSMGLDQNIQVVLPESSTLTIITTESSTLRLTAVDKGYMSLNSKCMCFCNLTMYLIVSLECVCQVA